MSSLNIKIKSRRPQPGRDCVFDFLFASISDFFEVPYNLVSRKSSRKNKLYIQKQNRVLQFNRFDLMYK